MRELEANSVDAVIADPPYGTTACKWDSVIPFEPMWKEIKRVAKESAAILIFGQNPFTANLIMSNPKMYRYDIVWEKDQLKNFFFVKKQIGKVHELISVFYRKQPTYNPQMRSGFDAQHTGGVSFIETHHLTKSKRATREGATDRYPTSVVRFSSLKRAVHPTQKPVELCEFLIRSFTNEGDTVLDFAAGSGSIGVAALRTNRKFIGIEMSEEYCEIARKRIEHAKETSA